MEKTILIAGKDFPDGKDFADGAQLSGRNVIVTSKSEVKEVANGEVSPFKWNKTSPVSARAVILFSETKCNRLDEVVLYFDEAWFASLYSGFSMEECTKSIDEMVLGYQYMALEVISKFEKRYLMDSTPDQSAHPGKLVFVIKKNPSELDVLKNASVRNTVSSVSGVFPSMAAAAFMSLAESIAALYGGREFVSVILAKTESSSETYKKDSAFSLWLCSYLDEVDKMKNKLTAKQSTVWVKAGAKGPGLLSLFR